MSRSQQPLIDVLEPRRLMSASAVDKGFNFSQAAIDSAAGQHIEVQTVTDAGAGRTLLLLRATNSTTNDRLILAELNSAGGLNRAFSGDGLADTGIDIVGGASLRVSTDGYIDVTTTTSVTRFRGDGGRDRSFNHGHGVDFTGRTATYHLLDAQANPSGGIDVLRSVSRDLGRKFVNKVYDNDEELFDNVVQLIHVSTDGSATKVWEKSARDSSIDDNTYVDFDRGSVTAIYGGWAVLSARQQSIDNFDSATGVDTVGDTYVSFVSLNGDTTSESVFNTGATTQLADVRVQGNGSRVRFTYGGRREVELTNATRIRRYNLPVGPSTPGLNDEVLTLNEQRLPYHIDALGTSEPKTLTLSLLSVSKQTHTDVGDHGKITFSSGPGYLGTVGVVSAQPGSVLLGWTTYQNHANTQHLERFWLGPQPAATLTGTAVRGRAATITVRYRAQNGIAPATVNSHDIVLTSRRGQSMVRLIGKAIVGDTVLATYRSADLPRGGYFVDFLMGQVGTGDNASNESQVRLGQFTVT